MRRIYTLQRKAGLDDWWKFWREDVEHDPGSAASIFEFVRARPLTTATVNDLIFLSQKYCRLYADVSILAAETIATAPVVADAELWSEIYRICHGEFIRLLKLSPQTPDIERIAAAWLMSAWKFGNEFQQYNVVSQMPLGSDSMSPVRAQALPLLACAGESLSEWVAAKPGLAWEDALAAEYLRSLTDGEDRAVGVALNLVRPELRLTPQRFTMLPRALPLVGILGRKAPKKLSVAVPKYLSDLRRNPDRLRDHKVEAILSKWCP
jgi:hypothetical protein